MRSGTYNRLEKAKDDIPNQVSKMLEDVPLPKVVQTSLECDKDCSARASILRLTAVVLLKSYGPYAYLNSGLPKLDFESNTSSFQQQYLIINMATPKPSTPPTAAAAPRHNFN